MPRSPEAEKKAHCTAGRRDNPRQGQDRAKSHAGPSLSGVEPRPQFEHDLMELVVSRKKKYLQKKDPTTLNKGRLPDEANNPIRATHWH
ncbi:hypothetical protein GB937_005850 [Aspergillus fischeri]|nr:hypothetical protein GB937_005850 [Aspergillus fischeri]